MDEGFMQIDTEELMGQVSLLLKLDIGNQVYSLFVCFFTSRDQKFFRLQKDGPGQKYLNWILKQID
jgi:hypothetical protein